MKLSTGSRVLLTFRIFDDDEERYYLAYCKGEVEEVEENRFLIALDKPIFGNLKEECVRNENKEITKVWCTKVNLRASMPPHSTLECTRENVHSALREKLKYLVFRRVGRVVTQPSNFISGSYCYYNSPGVVYKDLTSYLNAEPEEVREKIGVEKYKYWYAFTSSSHLRENEPTLSMKRESIWFDMYGYTPFDTKGVFEFKRKTSRDSEIAKSPPFIRKTKDSAGKDRTVFPLVCGYVTEKNGKFKYTKWFYASEQFYKLWTLIMYGPDVFPRRNKKEQILRKLRCNNTELYVKEGEEEKEKLKEDSSFDEHEMEKCLQVMNTTIASRHRIHRTEEEARIFFGIYQAIARYVVYRENEEDIDNALEIEYQFSERLYPGRLFEKIRTHLFWLKEA